MHFWGHYDWKKLRQERQSASFGFSAEAFATLEPVPHKANS